MKKDKFIQFLFLITMTFLLLPYSTLADQTSITLNETVHFSSPEGEKLVVLPGTYTVKPGAAQLHLETQDGKPVMAIKAEQVKTDGEQMEGELKEEVTEPTVFALEGKNGQIVVGLEQPGKPSLIAHGVRADVRSRGVEGKETGEEEGRAETLVSIVELDRTIHFQGLNKDDVIVGSGIYQIQAVDKGLRLTPSSGTSEESVIIKAQAGTHDEKLNSSEAEVLENEEGFLKIVLLLPKGQELSAVGSESGVLSRGSSPGNFRNFRVAVAIKNGYLLAKWRDPNICNPDHGDEDLDCIPDAKENHLALYGAPQVKLHPGEKYFPSSVDWYLAKAEMQFYAYAGNGGCSKKTIVKRGGLTQRNISQQSHYSMLSEFSHYPAFDHAKQSPIYKCIVDKAKRMKTNVLNKSFQIQPTKKNKDLAYYSEHGGVKNWPIYVHVKPVVTKGIFKKFTGDIETQYWMFYPANDVPGSRGTWHEGDWEMIANVRDAAGRYKHFLYASHGIPTKYFAANQPGKPKPKGTNCKTSKKCVWLTGRGSPVVYVASGTHAGYPFAGSHCIPGVPACGAKDNMKGGGIVWNTWENMINVGEKNYPMNKQYFIQYGGRWGTIRGSAMGGYVSWETNSGPTGPAFKPDKW